MPRDSAGREGMSIPAGRTVSDSNMSLMKAMSDMKPYAIRWKCTVTGRIGIGTIRFEKEEAERLVTELNEKYPNIDHETIIPAPPFAEPVAVERIEPRTDERLRPVPASEL